MARMIPPLIDPDTPSRGEIEIFERLRDDPRTVNWTVLHSLNVADHRSQVEGEIDFLIIVPGKGVICLEVKSSRDIRRRDGLWYYGRAIHGDFRGPFRQASEAMHSLRSRLVERRPELRNVVFWSAVAMPYSRFDEVSTEWHSWQLINLQSFSARPLSTLIESVLDHACEHLRLHRARGWFQQTAEPTAQQCTAIVDALRGNFEYFESPKDILRRQNDEVRRFTEEQFVALDAMAANPRVVFQGPAGTGKTFLAIEDARRSARQGHKTLFLCFNRLLGAWLKDQLGDLAPAVTTMTLHQHMLAVAGVDVPPDPSQSFWECDLPLAAIDILLAREDDRFLYDVLIVDEAQDMLRNEYLDLLDLSVRGGLGAGRWRLFGDFEKQAIYDASDVNLDELLAERGNHAPVYTLRKNCRNTPRIAAWTQLLGGLSPNYTGVLRSDDQIDPSLRFYAQADDQLRLLETALDELQRAGFSGNEIVILSTQAESPVASRVNANPWRDRLRPLSRAGRGQIGYTTIHAFKGMEAPAIVVTDLEHVGDDRSLSLLYIATSRPLHRLIVLAHERVRPDIEQLLLRAKPIGISRLSEGRD